jgi:hypothetical protein
VLATVVADGGSGTGKIASPPYRPVRRPAVGLSRSATPTGTLPPYPESQSYQRYPDPEREDADEPREGEQSRPGQDNQDYAQEHPQNAAQGHGPLVVDLPPEQYGADYPQEPAEDGPERDDVEQNDRGNAWPEDGEKTGQDTQCTLGQQQPLVCSAARPEPRDDGENPVDYGVGTVQYDQNREGKAWPDQRRQTEQHGGDPSHGQRPQLPDTVGIMRGRCAWLIFPPRPEPITLQYRSGHAVSHSGPTWEPIGGVT